MNTLEHLSEYRFTTSQLARFRKLEETVLSWNGAA